MTQKFFSEEFSAVERKPVTVCKPQCEIQMQENVKWHIIYFNCTSKAR